MIDTIEKINSTLNGIVWGWPVIILILGTGLLLSIRTKFLQVRKFGDSMNSTIVPTVKSLGKKNGKKKAGGNTVSQFEAFATAISGTVGTGNIVGVTAAILTGGPGAVFWMWISAFFGMVTNFSENVLGLYYRQKDGKDGFSGGAFYYIDNGLKNWKWFAKFLAYMAAVVCMLAAVGMSGVQTNKISGTLSGSLGKVFNVSGDSATVMKLIIGVIVAGVAAAIIIGGIKRIGKVASKLIPFMSVLFMILALIVIFKNITHVPNAFKLIFQGAFQFKAAGAGVLGYTFSVVIKKGMARGVFSNEAGLGSSVIAHSASETKEPVMQGLWGVFEVFFDTFIICTLTALMFMTTFTEKIGAGIDMIGEKDDSAWALSLFSDNFGTFGTVCFSVILPLFAFTTIMAWSYYGEKATEFCFRWLKKETTRKAAVLSFKILFVLFIVLAAVIDSQLVWDIDDTFNGLMSIPNLIALIAMSGTVVKITKNYYQRKKGLDVEPMLSAYPELNEEFKREIYGDESEKND